MRYLVKSPVRARGRLWPVGAKLDLPEAAAGPLVVLGRLELAAGKGGGKGGEPEAGTGKGAGSEPLGNDGGAGKA